MSTQEDKDPQEARDPLAGAPDLHPVGTGVGATVGGLAAAAAVAGTVVGGPAGTVMGAAVGAVVGGLGGKAVARHMGPEEIDQLWRERYASEPYHRGDLDYEDYAPAFRLGAEARQRHAGRFEEVEQTLAEEYERRRGPSRLDWGQARAAVHAAWEAAERG